MATTQQDFLSGALQSWRIRVTPAGDKATVLLDSGAITLRSTINLLFVVVTNTGTGTAPISLLTNDGTFGGEVLDQLYTPQKAPAANLAGWRKADPHTGRQLIRHYECDGFRFQERWTTGQEAAQQRHHVRQCRNQSATP